MPNKTTELRKTISDIVVSEVWTDEIMLLIEKTVLDVIGQDGKVYSHSRPNSMPDSIDLTQSYYNELRASQRDHLHKIVKGD